MWQKYFSRDHFFSFQNYPFFLILYKLIRSIIFVLSHLVFFCFFFLHVFELRKLKFLVQEIHPYTSFVLIPVLLEKGSISFATKISKIIQNKWNIPCIVDILKIITIFTYDFYLRFLLYFTLLIFNYVN